jgi:hypothetical protein
MQPSTAHSPQSAKDLDAVLVRFQAWSGSRKTKEVAEGVRELSYEDALQSSRHRWQGRAPESEATENIVPAPEPVVEKTLPIQAIVQNPQYEISEEEAFPDEVFTGAPDTLSFSSAVPEAGAVVPVKKESTWPPVFGAMLAEALTPAAHPLSGSHSGALARIRPDASKPERQVSMSLRVAASEQALIKARAAEAGISASAYLRQCALEVEQLRAQVQHTLAVIERKSTLALPAGEAPAHVSRRGFLGHMRRRIFGGRDTALTLRA